MIKTSLPLVLLALAWPAAASQPDGPLDCGDWVFMGPGLACAEEPRTSAADNYNEYYWGWPHVSVDVLGERMFVEYVLVNGCACPPECLQIHRTQVVRAVGATKSVVAYVEDRCYPQGGTVRVLPIQRDQFHLEQRGVLLHNQATGTLFIPLHGNAAYGPCANECEWIVSISGLRDLSSVIPPGPTGPAGPPGPQGSAGPQGIPGPLIPACPDADGDGFRDCAAIEGCSPYGSPCGDCSDHDRDVNPAQSERTPKSHRKDHKDNDCNGVIDGE